MPARLAEIASLFLKLGLIGFGGPAVHISLMEAEIVVRRKWLSHQRFLDLVGVTNLIPGPNSTEMVLHVGYLRAGLSGLAVAGVSFILPAVLSTSLLAWIYVRYGQLPQLAPCFSGIKPAVLVIVFFALWRLGRKAVSDWRTLLLGCCTATASLGGAQEIKSLILFSVAGFLWLHWVKSPTEPTPTEDPSDIPERVDPPDKLIPGAWFSLLGGGAVFWSAQTPSLWMLGLFFLKIGAILYGSGYVLFAYVDGQLVREFAWMTRTELLDAIAVGQFTPGPILSTATFIGYLVMAKTSGTAMGLAGAVVATVAIFLPSFLFVAVLGPILPRLRQSTAAGAFLDSVQAASIGLMASVTIKLCVQSLVDWRACVIFVAATVVVIRWKINPAWIVLGGAACGYLLTYVPI